MKINEEGLLISKPELQALLAFAGTSPELLALYGVQFKSDGARLTARATNGAVAAEADGECDCGATGEWFVHRDFLMTAKKLLDAKTFLRLSFETMSLRDAAIVDDEDNIRSTLTWSQDAIITQLELPNIQKLMDAKATKAQAITVIHLSAEYLGDLKLVSRAAGTERIKCCPPSHVGGPAVYTCDGGETTWRALIMPMRADEAEIAESEDIDKDHNTPLFAE